MTATVNVPSVDEVSSNKLFPLGTEYTAPDGNTYRYVQAGEAISTTENEPYCLAIDEDDQAMKATAALLLAGHRIGFAPEKAVANEYYFWARVRGSFSIRVAANTPADAALGPGATAGRLGAAPTTASAGNCVVLGVVITTAAATNSASAGNTIRTALVTYPLAKQVGV